MHKGFITCLIVAVSCAAQTPSPPGKNPVTKSPAAHSRFTCPDPEAQQACKSYSELLEAKDSGLPSKGYVCFRTHVDQFFVVTFDKPIPRRVQKQYGSGYFQTYDNGIAASDLMPNLVFSGKWIPLFESMRFASDDINGEPTPGGQLAVVEIDDTQLSVVGHKYKNAKNEDIEYTLTVQRSTGRFSEGFVKEGAQMPFISGTGRCVSR